MIKIYYFKINLEARSIEEVKNILQKTPMKKLLMAMIF